MSEALELVERMVDALNEHVIEGQKEFWSEDMVWHGPAGIGTKHGLKDFQENHQRPFFKRFLTSSPTTRSGSAPASGLQQQEHSGQPTTENGSGFRRQGLRSKCGTWTYGVRTMASL